MHTISTAAANHSRGVTLLDTVVGIALLLLVFLGIYGAFKLSVDVVINNKARAGAIALAEQRMEYIRSLPYTSVGTVGGVPSGALAQTESLTFNGVLYSRRTLVEYLDDPADGTGASDTTGIADYKAVKVDVSWTPRTGGTHDIFLVTRLEPTPDTITSTTPESSVSGGTLTVNVLNAASQPVANAQVTIANAATSPAVNLTTYTNTSGVVQLIGTPAASNYSVVVTKSGYSTAQTYTSSSQNRNPVPANLTVTNGQTTSSTFSIDQLSSLTMITLAYGTANPITNAVVTLQGAKTIGTSPIIYKYSASVGGTGSATTTISSLEWDTYSMFVNSSTGYDLASSCSPQPVYVAPGSSVTTTLYLAPHTTNSLPVKVITSSNGAPLAGASVTLSKSGYTATQTTDACGQTFFSGLSATKYSLSVSAAGHTTYNGSNISVSGTTTVYAVSLN
jgi:hypothetical protein